MAAGYSELDLEGQQSDTYPLLMERTSALSNGDHVVNITGNPSGRDEVQGGYLYNDSTSTASNLPTDTAVSVGSLVRTLSIPLTSQTRSTSAVATLRRVASLGRHGEVNAYGNRQRTSPLNSGLWISIELIITLSQIVASIIVLSLSRDEKPQAPLAIWVIGYAGGCLASLPLLYWRYTHRYVQQPDRDSLTSAVASPSSPPISPHASSYSLPISQTEQHDEADGSHSSAMRGQSSSISYSRMGVLMERFKIALDCYFAVWFVVGNVWIFGGHSSSSEAPNLYRLCIVFLTFSCIGYAMPFILCATICCCLPCIITLLGLRENQGQAKGASPEIIESLPIYKFRSKCVNGGRGGKDGNDSDSEGPGEGGFIAAGTEKERVVSAEDAVCCICLGKYKDDEELRELPCTHLFHVECVDKWLKINASCPLCKHDLAVGEQLEQSATDTGEQRHNRVVV
eukprot:c25360_g3_i1 orf=553-1917(+)